jgi:hypothetical protein
MKYPDTPEGAAVFLMTLVLENRRDGIESDPMTKTEILALYAHCLKVAKGEEDVSHGPLH